MGIVAVGAGAGAGFLVGGPIGAVVGGVAGGFLGGGAAAGRKPGQEPPPMLVPPSAQGAADLVNSVIASSPWINPGSGAGPLTSPFPPFSVRSPLGAFGRRRPPHQGQPVMSDFGDIGPFPLWLVVVGLGTAAYVYMRKPRRA